MAHRKQVLLEEVHRSLAKRAKLSPCNDNLVCARTEPSCTTVSSVTPPSTDDDNISATCGKEYKLGSRFLWIECSFCKRWYHRKCDPNLKSQKAWKAVRGENATYACISCGPEVTLYVFAWWYFGARIKGYQTQHMKRVLPNNTCGVKVYTYIYVCMCVYTYAKWVTYFCCGDSNLAVVGVLELCTTALHSLSWIKGSGPELWREAHSWRNRNIIHILLIVCVHDASVCMHAYSHLHDTWITVFCWEMQWNS